jgi:hypothetical protein
MEINNGRKELCRLIDDIFPEIHGRKVWFKSRNNKWMQV